MSAGAPQGRVRGKASPAGDQPDGLPPAGAARCQPMPQGTLAIGMAVFAVSVVVLAAVELASPGQRSMIDLQIYRWAGLIVAHSGDLYASHFSHYSLPFTYTPMAALIFAAVSAFPLTALKWLITAGSVAALAGTVWLAWGMLGYRRSAGRLGATLAVAGVALWLGPVRQTIGLGQVNLILMLIIMADLSRPDSARLKGVGVGLAAGFKLTPLIFIPYLLLSGRFRAAGLSLATFALTIGGSLIVSPGLSRHFWFTGLFWHSSRVGNRAYVGNQSLYGTLDRLLGSAATAYPYWLAIAAVVGVTGLVLAALAARRGRELTGILTCALTGLLVSPISWAHHWVWAAPALVLAADAVIRLRAPTPATPYAARSPRSPDRWPAWRRRLGRAGLAAALALFFALPQDLVPGSVLQGTDVDGAQLLTTNLHVIAGLVALCVAGLYLVSSRTAPVPLAKE
jgi:alpha-1,2-mannosyltransferase